MGQHTRPWHVNAAQQEGIVLGHSGGLQILYPSQEPPQIQEVGERLTVIVASDPRLLPLGWMDLRVVPDQRARRRRSASPRRAEQRLAHRRCGPARAAGASLTCLLVSTRTRLRTFGRTLATSTPSACHLPRARRQHVVRLYRVFDAPVSVPRRQAVRRRRPVSRVVPVSKSSSGWVGISRPSRRIGVGHRSSWTSR